MRQDELRAVVEGAGWRVGHNPMPGEFNQCDWYAWMPKRPADWPDCECNDKPPSLVMHPSFMRLPDGREVSGVAFDLTGEMAGRWFKLEMYSVKPEEALQAGEKAIAMLGKAWKALAELKGKP